MKRSLYLTLLSVCGAITTAHAGGPVLPAALRNVGFDQRLNEQLPLDINLKDEDGHSVQLSQYFQGKPVILVLAYYRCPRLCTQVLSGLVEGLRESSLVLGKDYRVVTISFDPADTPEAARKKKSYLRYFGEGADQDAWRFLTGSQDSIHRVTEAVGYRYSYDAATQQFAHAAGIVILTPTGKISRYLYDVKFAERDLRLGLIEASQNQIGSPIDQILLFCFHYDPTAGRYGAAIMNIVRAGGVCTVLGLVAGFYCLRRVELTRLARLSKVEITKA